jgi:hypothetical protein
LHCARATAQSKTGIFRDYGVAEVPPGFQAGWFDCVYFFFSLSAHLARSSGFSVFVSFAHLEFPCKLVLMMVQRPIGAQPGFFSGGARLSPLLEGKNGSEFFTMVLSRSLFTSKNIF